MDSFASSTLTKRGLLVIDCSELRGLMSKSCYYYVSGLIAIIYSGKERDIYNQLKLVRQYLTDKSYIRIVHIINENVYFESLNKVFTDLIDGQVVTLKALCPGEGELENV